MQPTARSAPHVVEGDGHRAAGVAQVPQHQRAGVVRDRGERRAVGQVQAERYATWLSTTSAVCSRDGLGQQVGGDAGRGVDVDPAQRQPALAGDAVGDVAVGREVVAVDHDLGAPGPGGHRGAHQLVEQHRGRVADGDLARRGAQADPADLVAEGQRQVEPALVPAADQPAAPLVGHEVAQPLGRDRQRAAQRVAVEVDEVGVGPDEAVAVRRQRVVVVIGLLPPRTTRACAEPLGERSGAVGHLGPPGSPLAR